MDNQHRKITGYRDLSEDEINGMNAIKALGAEIGELVEAMKRRGTDLDQRWVAIGATEMQQGLMALTRAIAQPTTF